MTTLQMLGSNPAMRRAWLEHNTGHTLQTVADMAFTPEEVRSNIENLVGAVHVPLGVAGPIRVNGTHAQGTYHVPFATTEGTLVTTYQAGMRAITEAGGANAYVLADSLDITPCFMLGNVRQAISFSQWLEAHLDELRDIAAESTAHGRLVELHTHIFGRRVFARFVFTTGDAMGMNMINLAVDQICRHAIRMTEGCERYYLRCNYSSDKKPAAINLSRPYGKEVAIDVTLPGSVVEKYLGVSARDLLDFITTGRLGAMQAGALGMNAHFANGLAAIFIACGQDVAQVVNASIGFCDAELLGDDLYVFARLPNLVVATVGGGTDLPTQRKCLELLDCRGDGTAPKFAEIVAATLVGGELAIAAALANGRFIEAHRQNRRRNEHPPA
jgi:hydroxymethylglutaryl-CoA reductase (NADPH)